MRYTTIIDISTSQVLYRSHNIRLVYLHLCLKAGYHDNDRDLVRISIRTLAADVGLTVGAVRHALEQLHKYRMITKRGDLWQVAKWVNEQPITTRAKTAKQQAAISQQAALKKVREEREQQLEIESMRRKEILAGDKSSWQLYVESQAKKAAAGDPDAIAWCDKHKDDKMTKQFLNQEG